MTSCLKCSTVDRKKTGKSEELLDEPTLALTKATKFTSSCFSSE